LCVFKTEVLTTTDGALNGTPTGAIRSVLERTTPVNCARQVPATVPQVATADHRARPRVRLGGLPNDTAQPAHDMDAPINMTTTPATP